MLFSLYSINIDIFNLDCGEDKKNQPGTCLYAVGLEFTKKKKLWYLTGVTSKYICFQPTSPPLQQETHSLGKFISEEHVFNHYQNQMF